MKVKILLDNYGIMPTRAHDGDAGMDIYTPMEFTVPAHGSTTVSTGVHLEIPYGFTGFIKSKSGLNVKLYNHSDRPHTFERGDKITQLVILPILLAELELVTELEDTERGNGGFGSTGK